MIETSELVQVSHLVVELRYAQKGLPGAMNIPYLAPDVADALRKANRSVALLSRGSLAVGVLDAYRALETQKHLFDAHVAEIIASQGLTYEEAVRRAPTFVSPPWSTYPHGTGGAVDVTLYKNGAIANMGTDFDDFTLKSARDYYRDNPPSPEESEASHHREILRKAMEGVGFVGLDSEYWHFEMFTQRWADETGGTATLTTVLPEPNITQKPVPPPQSPDRPVGTVFGVEVWSVIDFEGRPATELAGALR